VSGAYVSGAYVSGAYVSGAVTVLTTSNISPVTS
jgi:hypothetical protein